jgi:hypothetical protein
VFQELQGDWGEVDRDKTWGDEETGPVRDEQAEKVDTGVEMTGFTEREVDCGRVRGAEWMGLSDTHEVVILALSGDRQVGDRGLSSGWDQCQNLLDVGLKKTFTQEREIRRNAEGI